jgi:pyruvate/2-oxoglutarate dehydrogenase complex dihydrolipoamide acyltransferase (E2) component
LGTYLTGITICSCGRLAEDNKIGEFMRRRVFQLKIRILRHLVVPGLVLLLGLGISLGSNVGSALAQSGDTHNGDQQGKPSAADAAKENQRKVDQFVEAAQAINGPAGNPECVWLGRRVVQLVLVDDLDTAFRHLDLYDRFGCPGGHIQAAFRCVTRFMAQIDDKVPNSLRDHVHACWINPAAQPQQAAAATPASAPSPAPSATPTTSGAATPAAPQPAASPSPAPPAK